MWKVILVMMGSPFSSDKLNEAISGQNHSYKVGGIGSKNNFLI